MKLQRYLCRNCGRRFSEPKPLKQKPERLLNTDSASFLYCQVGDSKEGSKNLTLTENPLRNGLAGATNAAIDSRGKIVEFSFWLLEQGYSPATIKSRVKRLNRLVTLGANLNDEESVKEVIARQKWSVSSRVNAVDAYDSLLKMLGRTWKPPIYRKIRLLPFIPTEAELDQLIAGCSRKMATFLQMLKETGMRAGEACQLKWTEIDLVNNSVRVTPEKGGNPRNLKISNKLVCMLNETPKNNLYAFAHATDMWIRNFSRQRKRIAAKLKNARLLQITFHTFRHWKATTEYHKTKDILHVKELLGHKSINSTLLYTQLVNFNEDDEFTVKVAHSEQEACQLIEVGFEYICDFERNKLFRKRK
ncbi:TPA: site-specific integrase [Candidatus Bathyarchaeota archaeon]|nr:site-specific integrase [Candidatus Bathyarchaeota archaeon]